MRLSLGQPLPTLAPIGAAGDKFPAALTSRPSAARLLVADDHPINLEVILRQLELFGLSAETAEDGATALAKWRNEPHAVVLLDLHMPAIDGFELAKSIRFEEALRALPRTGLIAVTADAMKGKKARCFAAGIDGFVTKPVSIEALARALAPWMSNLVEKPPSSDSRGTWLFDPNLLRGLFGEDAARLSELVQNFADCAARDLEALHNARNAKQLATSAHRLKGAARLAGANLMAEQAERVEAAATTDGFAGARHTAEGMEAIFAETLRAMRSAA